MVFAVALSILEEMPSGPDAFEISRLSIKSATTSSEIRRFSGKCAGSSLETCLPRGGRAELKFSMLCTYCSI